MLQGWGMTRPAPLRRGSGGRPAGVVTGSRRRADCGRCRGASCPAVELRIVAESGRGHAVGPASRSVRSRVRGPWITASYYDDPAPDRLPRRLLRTGDIAAVTADGLHQDQRPVEGRHQVGGEWIFLVELRGILMRTRSARGRR